MKNILFHRDFLILALLIFMLKVGVEIREPTVDTAPMLNSPANSHIVHAEEVPSEIHETAQRRVATDTDDTWEVAGHEMEKEQKKELEPFLVHEVDQNVLKQIECAQSQINQALDIAQPTSLDAAQLRSLQQKLTQLRTQYQSSSPAVALLGPLGAAAIVLKEDNLEKELLHTVKKVSSIIHNLAGNIHTPTSSIVKELETNHAILHELIHA